MSDNLNRLIETSDKMIGVAKCMLHACQLKKNKVYTYQRFVISFFLRRSWESFESFLILIKENRIIDGAVLLRSFLEMGINLGYIYAKDINEAENEKRALRYLLDGNRQQLKLINSNLDGFKEFDKNIEARRDEINAQIAEMEGIFREKYRDENWELPRTIEERARLSKYEVLQLAYNQSYRDLSNIEHHSILFGEHYVDSKECEPLEEIDHLKYHSQLRPAISLFLFRAVFIEILNIFNREFRLTWETQLTDLRKLQDEEYALLKE